MIEYLYKVAVKENQEIAKNVFLISFLRECDFKPGQLLDVTLDPEIEPKAYNICSGPSDSEMRILYNKFEEGKVPSLLAKLKTGGSIWVSKPYGDFIGTVQPAFWIASGTGIAPFYSMMKGEVSFNKYLVHGVQNTSRFYFHDEFEQRLGDHYVKCAPAASGEGFFHGRVSDFIRSHHELPLDNKYYLCGKTEMIDEVKELLIERGVSYSNIISEIHI